MKHGTVNCSCGQMFYFETLADSIKCIKCQKVYNTESFPEKVEEIEKQEEEILQAEGDI